MNAKHNPYIMLSIILLCFSLINSLSFGTDTISGNQSLSADQTIVSSGGNFELGFFQPGNSSNFYIGIWYKRVSVQTVVWVANREIPISNKFSSELKILNGNLVLLNEFQVTVWSTNMNSATSDSVVAVLGDDGNFVLKYAVSSNSTQPLWQSFDYPTHTYLPGSRIGFNKHTNKSQILTSWKNSDDPAPGLFSLELDPNAIQVLTLWNRSQSYWTSGSWNGRIFNDVPEMRLKYNYNFSRVSNENESYFTYSVYDPSIISRIIMDVSGQIKLLTSLDSSREWDLFWFYPRQQCEVYAYCGSFGTCNQNALQPCDCLLDFVPKYAKDWDLGDFSGGCVRKSSLQCGEKSVANEKKARFRPISYMRMPQAVNQSVQSAVECRSMCLSQCECTAYAFGINRCSIWYGELLNVEQLPESGGAGETVYIKLAASEFPSPPRNKKAVVIGSVIGSVVGSLAVMGLVIFWRRKNKKEGSSLSIF